MDLPLVSDFNAKLPRNYLLTTACHIAFYRSYRHAEIKSTVVQTSHGYRLAPDDGTSDGLTSIRLKQITNRSAGE